MAQRKKASQSQLEENRKAKNKASKPEQAGGTPVHQIVQRLSDSDLEGVDPESIKELQQTVGNRVVSQLVSSGSDGGTSSVQRDPFNPVAEDKELVAGSPTQVSAPGASSAVPMPYPNTSPGTPGPTGGSKVETGATAPSVSPGSKLGSSMGDEPGTMKGVTSPAVSSNMPGHSPVVNVTSGVVPFQAPGSTEQEGTQPTQTPAPETEEQETS